MNLYLTLKALHILSSVILVGTGFGTAFYFFFANRTRSVPVIAAVSRLVVRADWWFTTPAVVAQPLTGWGLMHLAGWPWRAPWIMAAVALYLLAGLCWLPVVGLQMRLARRAAHAQNTGKPLPPAYWRDARRWELLGYPAFAAMLAIYFLMVLKPSLAWG
ncbi:MAG: DUF2269 domain-containing protein [Burkholderiaceae bacterium]|jgi:uncharacterized membrane protein|nr:DUF2269 domain-containing protein [Burkholderiaceae bacterium]